MKRPTFRAVIGSFRLIRQRAEAERATTVGVWVDTGEQATVAVQSQIRDGAHRAEVGALGIEGELREVLADGKVTPAELRRLQKLSPRVHRVAEECHDVGEVVR